MCEVLANIVARPTWRLCAFLFVLLFGVVTAAHAGPTNDNFVDAITISGPYGSVAGNNIGATNADEELGVILSPYSGGATIWYAWTAPFDGIATFDTVGSVSTNGNAMATLLGAYMGTDFSDFAPAGTNAENDVDALIPTNAPASRITFPVFQDETYYIVVDGDGGDQGDILLNWSSLSTGISAGFFDFTANLRYPSDGTGFTFNEGEGQQGSTTVTVTRTKGAVGAVDVNYLITFPYVTNIHITNVVSGSNLFTTNLVGSVPQIDGNNTNTTSFFFWNNSITVPPYTINVTTNLLATFANSNSFGTVDFTNYLIAIGLNSTNVTITQVSDLFSNVFVTNVFIANQVDGTNIWITNYLASVTNSTAAFKTTYFPGITFSNSSISPGITNLTYLTNSITNGFGVSTNIQVVETLRTTNLTITKVSTPFTNVLVRSVFTTNQITGTNLFVTNTVRSITNSGPAVVALGQYLTPMVRASLTNSGIVFWYNDYFGQNITFVTNFSGTISRTNNIGTLVYTNKLITFTDISTNITDTDITAPNGGPYKSSFGNLTYPPLHFDDYQMSQSLKFPFKGNNSVPNLDQIVTMEIQPGDVVLSSNETANINIPIQGATAKITILDDDSNPKHQRPFEALNFGQTHYSVHEDTSAGVIQIQVTRSLAGTNTGGCTVNWSIDPPDSNGRRNNFALSPGSDYALPDVDFADLSGSVSWPDTNDYNPRTITIPIFDDNLVEFHEDFIVRLSNPAGQPAVVGNIDTTSVTIIGDHLIVGEQPAGAVDRTYNIDNVAGTSPPYNQHPGANQTVYAIAVQPTDDYALIGGDFGAYDQTSRPHIARVKLNGQLDTSFNPGTGPNDFVSTISVSSAGGNGSIVIGGGFTSFNGFFRRCIARLNANGSLDSTFNPGLGADNTVWASAIQSDGKVVIGGDFSSVNGVSCMHVARLNTDGSVDTTFNTSFGADSSVYGLAVQPDGRIVIGGQFTKVAGLNRAGIARLNVDGTLDTSFDPGSGADNAVYAVALQSDGKVLVGGAFTTEDLTAQGGIARLNVDGSLDTAFGTGTGADDTVYTISVQPDGAIFVAGIFTSFNSTRRVGCTRLLANGNVDTSFMDTAYNQYAGIPNALHSAPKNFVFASGLQSDGGVLIGGSFLEVGGYDERYGGRTARLPRSNVARLVGGATTGPGNLQFSFESYSASENAKAPQDFSVTLQRVNGDLGSVKIQLNTDYPSAGPGAADLGDVFGTSTTSWITNYNRFGPNNTWMLSAGDTDTQYPTVTIVNDGLIEGDETAYLLLSQPIGVDTFQLGGENIPLGAALGTSFAPLTVVDADTQNGVLGFSQLNYFVNENATNAVITITRTNGSAGVVTVQYATTGGSAVAGINYQSRSGTLTLRGGQTTATISIPIIDNAVIDADKTINVSLFNAAGGASLGQAAATITIVDNDYLPGHLVFASTNISVREDVGIETVAVNRLGGSKGVLSVQVATRNGTAVHPTDYLGGTNTLSWNDGDSAPKTFSFQIQNNLVVDGNRSLTLSLLNASSSGALMNGNPTNAVVTIVDDDSYGVLSFNAADYFVYENGSFATVTVVRQGGLAGPLTVRCTTMDDTATGGDVNYSSITTNLTFNQGELSKRFTIPIINNTNTDGDLDFTVELTAISPVGLTLGLDEAYVNIWDDETHNEPAGSPDPAFSPGSANDIVYAIALQNEDLQGEEKLLIGGNFSSVNGLTRHGIARFNRNGTLDTVFSSATKGITNGSVRALASQTDGRVLVAGQFSVINGTNRNNIARLNLDGSIDNSFNPGSGTDNPVYSVVEVPGASRKVLIGGAFGLFNGISRAGVAQLNDDGSLDTAFNSGTGANGIVYAIAMQADGKIVLGGDFTKVNGIDRFRVARLNANGSLDTTFNPGLGADNSVRTIAVQADGQILIGGVFTNVAGVPLNRIARLNRTDGSLDTSFTSGVGANDTVYAMALQLDGKIILGGEFTRCSGVTRSRVTRLNADGTVDPFINFGLGADSFVAAVVVQSDGKIVLGGGFENFDGLSHPHVVRLHGGDLQGSGSLEFASANFYADENAGNAPITVRRRGGTGNLSGDVSVSFATSDLTAQAGVNYQSVNTNILFPLGETFVNINVPVLVDGIVTNDKTAQLTLSNPQGDAITNIQPTAVLTIYNDDSTVSFTLPDYNINESAANGAATIFVSRSGSSRGSISVGYTTLTNGTATAGVDYLPTNGILAFSAGEISKSFTVPINNDTNVEADETVWLQLTNFVGAIPGAQTNSILTILDDDLLPGTISFSAATYSVLESNASVTISVTRTNGRTGIVSVHYATSDGNAVAGSDYGASSGTLSFTDGETQKTLVIPILDDAFVEGNEFFTVTLSVPTGGAVIGGSPSARITIIDDEFGPGSLDLGFDPGSGSDKLVRSIALQSDGRLVIGGAFTNFNSTNCNYVARLNTDGSLDTSFNVGAGPNSAVNTVALTTDGQIAFGGSFTNVSGLAFNRIGRFTTNGTADVNFSQPSGLNAAVNGLAIQSDGKFVAGGGFSAPLQGIARFRANGSSDPSFGSGSGADGAVYAVALTTNNQVVLGGGFNSVNGIARSRIARLNADELVDLSFNPPAITNGNIYALLLQPDGKVVVAGDFTSVNGTNRNRIIRLNVDGTLDTTFNAGSGANASIFAIVAQVDGKLIIGGDFTSINGIARNRIARLNADGSLDTVFDSGVGADNTVYSIAIAPDGKCFIGGDFTTVNGFSRKGVARINGDLSGGIRFLSDFVTPTQFQTTIKSYPGRSYALEYSVTLTNWTTLFTNQASMNLTNGQTLQFVDTNAPATRRFYRVRQVGP